MGTRVTGRTGGAKLTRRTGKPREPEELDGNPRNRKNQGNQVNWRNPGTKGTEEPGELNKEPEEPGNQGIRGIYDTKGFGGTRAQGYCNNARNHENRRNTGNWKNHYAKCIDNNATLMRFMIYDFLHEGIAG